MVDGQGDDARPDDGGRSAIDRRKALGLGAAAAGAAWVAPAILSVDAAAAATGDECDTCGFIVVNVAGCIAGGAGLVELIVTPQQGPVQQIEISSQTPNQYIVTGLCEGRAQVRLVQDGLDICNSPIDTQVQCQVQGPTVNFVCPC